MDTFVVSVCHSNPHSSDFGGICAFSRTSSLCMWYVQATALSKLQLYHYWSCRRGSAAFGQVMAMAPPRLPNECTEILPV